MIYVVRESGPAVLAEPRTPAKPGDRVMVYCAGLGAVETAIAAGVPAPDPAARIRRPDTGNVSRVGAGTDWSVPGERRPPGGLCGRRRGARFDQRGGAEQSRGDNGGAVALAARGTVPYVKLSQVYA
jgi:hypothetical protein